MIAFGIDPGSRRTGWGVVVVDGQVMRAVDHGVIRARESAPLCERLELIFAGLSEALEQHRPDAVFLESIFHHKSASSALVLGHARGVAVLAAQMKVGSLEELAPAEVKKTVTGRGRADKVQVAEMVRILLRLATRPPEDAADALAIAVAGATRCRSRDRAVPSRSF